MSQLAQRRRRAAESGAAALLALGLAGCCSLAGLRTILAPPDIDPELRAELAAAAAAAAAPPAPVVPEPLDRDELDLSDADRCDFLDPARCLLPFPNDRFTVADGETADEATETGLRLRFDPAATPQNRSGDGVDPAAWAASDGFSPGATILTHVPGLDLETSGAPTIRDPRRSLEPDSPIVVVDAESGERWPVWAELDAQAAPGERRALIVRPAKSFAHGRRYLVALRRLRDAAGETIPPARGFTIYRDRVAHGDPAVEERRAEMEEVFQGLADAGVERSDLYLAWGFTVASSRGLAGRLLHIRDDAFAALGGSAPEFDVLCRKKIEGDGAGGDLRRVWGSFRVPAYLTGDGGPGERLSLGDDGQPRRRGTLTAYFSCIVPESGSSQPTQASLYGHGLLNSLDEVAAGDVQAMAREHGFAFCATNWSGLSAPDTLQAVRFLRDASEFPAIPDRLLQGILNTLFLGRLMIHPDGLASHRAFRKGGRSLLDTSTLVYDGNSQGSVVGGVATAVAADWTRAVLGVPGMNYSLFLERSADFAHPRFRLGNLEVPAFGAIFRHSYPNALDRQIVLALIQILWDRAELDGHAPHLVGDPYPGAAAPKRVLLHEAFGDRALSNVATELLARSAGVHLRHPPLLPGRDPRVDPFFGIPPVPGLPFEGSALVVWDAGSCPTPLTNRAPLKRNDPHGAVRRQESARRQKAEFLRRGVVVEVCGTEPCFACGGEACGEFCSEVDAALRASD